MTSMGMNIRKWLNSYIFPIILLLYPLRHINWGVDLWDTGYNYANYANAGLQHVDSMWFFSTYLSHITGHFLTLLPGGRTLLFLNLYTGLLVSLLAIGSYIFLTKNTKIPPLLVFGGEIIAVSLCWCPTALLYNYLTYVLLLAGVILLYKGLTKDKNVFFILAGICLGFNLFVRLPNLLQAGLIIAVWVYGFICKKKVKKILTETLFCIVGYLAAVGLMVGIIAIKYGLNSYFDGIKQLFSMTSTATDYKSSSMIWGVVHAYTENIYWAGRLALVMIVGMLVCSLFSTKLKAGKQIFCLGLSACCAVWLYTRKFCIFDFTDYYSMLRPSILFLMLTIIITTISFFYKKTPREEKLLAGLILLTVLFTPIGSNNGLYPAINNLFLAVPYVFYMLFQLIKLTDEYEFPEKWHIPLLKKINITMVKYMVALLCLIFTVQGFLFGTRFVFVEASGVKSTEAKIENNDVLKGIYTESERANQISELSEYVKEHDLSGKEVLLYGQIPGISFYLNMPAAFNPWCDLRSYRVDTMKAAMEKMEENMTEDTMPVVILESSVLAIKNDDKLNLIFEYMDKYHYQRNFMNTKFVLFEAEKRAYD